jgi:hypothetical protein
MVSIDDILSEQCERKKKKTKIYKKIYKLVERKIIDCSKVNNTGCYFTVPLFLINIPIYCVNECKIYLIQKLKKDGFKINNLDNNIIYISWDI